MKNVMIRAFSPYRKVEYYRNHTLAGVYGDKTESLKLLDFTCPFIMKNEASVFVFKNGAVSFGGIKLPSSYIPVFESSNRGAVHMLAHTGCPVVTCGMSPRDTLSFSSNAFPTALVSVQRDIRTTNGRIIEPADFPVLLTGKASEYSVLAACATLLLMGFDADAGFKI